MRVSGSSFEASCLSGVSGVAMKPKVLDINAAVIVAGNRSEALVKVGPGFRESPRFCMCEGECSLDAQGCNARDLKPL